MAQQAAAAPLELEVRIPLGAVRGRIDHLAVDPIRKRIFIAELENNSLGVVDLNSARLLRRIGDLSEPQGAALVYVGYGSGALAVIDPVGASKRKDIALASHPESFRISRRTRQIFVNLPDAQAIAVIALDAPQQPQIWPVGNGRRGNFAMALDDELRHLIVVFRTPPKLGVLDSADGALIVERDTCGDVDDVFLDAERQRIYVICGEGFIEVFEARAAYARLARIATRRGARTALLSPALDRLAVAIRASGHEPAALWIYRPLP